MKENNLKAKDLAELLNVSKGLVSDILNYKKVFQKILSAPFQNTLKSDRKHLTDLTKLMQHVKLKLKLKRSQVSV